MASSAVRDARQGFGGRGSAAQGEVLEIAPRLVEDILVGTGAGEMDEDSADRDFQLRANLEELEPDGAAGGLGKAGAL